jgi:hypothetical protein
VIAIGTGAARAGTELVVNGDFEQTTLTASGQFRASNVTGWSTTGYNFLYFPGTATTTGGQGDSGTVKLWGNNGFVDSPTGGNFVAADGAYEVKPISQTINGLTVGQRYDVSFYWGAAQQSGYTGLTTERWDVSLGGQTQSTATANNPNHGFTGWFHQTFTYTATSTSEVLSFLSQGTPTGEPPFALLDGVSVQESTSIAEPAAASFLLGVVAIGAIRIVRPARRTA